MTKFKYKDTVKIISGFYKGTLGVVVGYQDYDDGRYEVLIGHGKELQVLQEN